MTLGNSLRRVLLSSIAGSAVTAFRIEGVSHEFTTVSGIKEDAVDIMLNLKGLSVKVFTDEPITLRLEKKGSGVVTAADIKSNADVQIVNPKLVIATIDDPKGSLVMDIVVDTGRGYQTVEQSRAQSNQSDMIVVDALYSPVTRVRYKVEDTRVGQTTDLDKLLLTIDTDGTISPKDAFEEAAAILVNQYTALAGQTQVASGKPLSVAEDADGDASRLMTPIEDLNLSARTTNALINNDIKTISDLVTIDDSTLRDMKGFGSKALDEVRDKLAEMEL
jgi:DNA-directed RNA polymerase subunit alpha